LKPVCCLAAKMPYIMLTTNTAQLTQGSIISWKLTH